MLFSIIIYTLIASYASLSLAQCAVSPAVHIIAARGTGERPGVGAQQSVVTSIQKRLPGSSVEAVDYPATTAQPASNNAGNAAMTRQITAYAQACPNSKIVLMGYSQGAQVLGDVVSGGGTGTFTGKTDATPPLTSNIASKVIAMISFGDPTRVRNPAYDYDQTGCTADAPFARTGTVNTKWQSYASKIMEYCDQWDLVCCKTANILGGLTHLLYLSPQNINAITVFVAAKAEI